MNEKSLVLALEIVFILAVCLLISSFRNPEISQGDPFQEQESATVQTEQLIQ